MQTRAEVLQRHDEMPAYLLMPEAVLLIDSELNVKRRLAMEIMYMTGCRVSEMLLLTPRHFVFSENGANYVNIPTLKKRNDSKKITKKRRRKFSDTDLLGTLPLRQVPISDPLFIERVKSYIVTEQLSPSRRFFSCVRRTVNRWIEETVERYIDRNGPFQVHISPHTFRHSFAVNAVLHFTPARILQSWLGHSSISSTEVYMNVLFSDTFAFSERISWRPYTLHEIELVKDKTF